MRLLVREPDPCRRLCEIAKIAAGCAIERLFRHLGHGAARQGPEREGPIGDADQAVDLESERGEHAPDLAILAFAQAHCEPAIVRGPALEPRLDGPIDHAIDGDAVREGGKARLIDSAVRPHAIAPYPSGRRHLEPAGEAAIIGEEDQPLGIEIEPADRDHARQMLRQTLEKRRSAPRIPVRRHEAGRLVASPQPGRFRGGDLLAIDQDAIETLDQHGRATKTPAIESDPPGRDHALDLPARGDAGTRKRLCDPLALSVPVRFSRHGADLRAGGFKAQFRLRCPDAFPMLRRSHGWPGND